jgi:hypothetical protein
MLTSRVLAVEYTPQQIEQSQPFNTAFSNYQINKLSVNDNILPDSNTANTSANHSLPPVPMLQLANGIIVKDYTNDSNFVKRLENMSYQEAESLSVLVNQHKDCFPMPCMNITAKILDKSIDDILKHYSLSKRQIKIFRNLQQELRQLYPFYPYNASFILVYKILLCKSVIENKSHKIALNSLSQLSEKDFEDTVKNYHSYVMEDKFTMNLIGINSTADFQDDCCLDDIINLPWGDIFKPTFAFEEQLIRLYKYNFAFEHSTTYADGKPISPFKTDNILVPYTGCLTINNLNKIWPLPVWLVGCSVKELTNADGYDAYSSCFFEHDLFHLRMKVYGMQTSTESYDALSTWIKRIYTNKMFFDNINIKFFAVELAIFWIMHEKVIISRLRLTESLARLSEISEVLEISELYGLHRKYANISFAEIKKAAKFLSYLSLDITTDDALRQNILWLMANIEELNLKADTETTQQKYFHCYQAEPKFIKKMITFIKENHRQLESMGLICSQIEANLRIYTKKSQAANNNRLTALNITQFMELSPFKLEAAWVVLYTMHQVITSNA